MKPPLVQAAQVRDFAARVVAWQRLHGRHGLPWQGTRDPYRIWLSEIMLQQTQVATVLRYYGRFLQQFPSVMELGQASIDEVLALWSGLGYYSRARNLHACAQAVLRDHGGVFPCDAAVLERLPGIGRSTAAAVAAFSSGQRKAILDGNVKRVLTRHRAFDQDVAKPSAMRDLWDLAESLLPMEEGIEPYTQGLMDLGATVCLLRRPRCAQCPLQSDCAAHALGRPTDFPVKTRRVKRGQRESVLLMALSPTEPRHSPRQVLLQQRPASGIWAGLWTLPLFEDEAGLTSGLAACGFQDGAQFEVLPTVQHALTHLEWTLRPRRMVLTQDQWAAWAACAGRGTGLAGAHQPAGDALAQGRWMPVEDALTCGLPAPIRKLLEDYCLGPRP